MINLGQASVSLELREVFRCGVPLRVGTRAFDILELLITCPGRLVSKDEILRRVWPDTVVEENNLQVHVSALRKALGEDRDLIRTIPGRGYMLVGGEGESALAVAAHEDPLTVGSFGSAMPRKHDLPHNIPLIGREAALEDVCEALLSDALVSLVGSGGIGKTSLAVAAAHHLSLTDSLHVCFVPLAHITCPDSIVESLASALDLVVLPGRSPIEAIVECLDQQNRLIILDNCEHLIDAVAAISEHLLCRCPSLRILITSREPLRIGGERMLNVAPLDTPELQASRQEVLLSSSAQLFMTRLQALDPYFPAENMESLDQQSVELIAQVCRHLDGIPLALEMAAARAATLGLFELLQSLQHGPHLLSGGLRSAPDRHQSLVASVEWSYGLLSPDERKVLKRLGRFEDRFTLAQACERAQSLALPQGRVMDCIVSLAQKSLLLITAEGPFRFYRLLRATRSWLVETISELAGDNGSTQGIRQHNQHSVRPASMASVATLRAVGGGLHDSDYFHLNHQRILATSQ
ncbi:ATP-binding protein [Pseudomonas quasicaspiana]|uniref:ATP-binding protein n=1 Tax=Pseudomonas quasicaspiana TaxID=2829821 RepID=UPI001E2C7A8F|nr:winged helix-turn-helix domain-containing protein [Pseudomonas quasicaspiana]MCD5975258.1 winged helix-turn-helix domain-containing protein [Pseudomonas quasicaspiana]